jgi:hypothetical protein
MSTRALAITLGPQLVALITGPANPASNGSTSAGTIDGPSIGGASSIVRMLAMPGVLIPILGALVDVDMLLELLQGVLGAVGEGIKAGAMEVARGVVVREHVVRGKGVVGREAVQRVREHLDDGAGKRASNAGRWREGGEGRGVKNEVPPPPIS